MFSVDLELTLGEGPGQDAAEASGPVLASDLGDAGAARRWPLFAAAACEAGAAAVFAFPLQVGAIRAGVTSSSASASRRHLSGCAPTLMSMTCA